MISRRKLLSGAASAALATAASDAHSGLLRGAPTFAAQARFRFTLASTSTTSAGVFSSTGALIRTLWSNVQYSAGTYSGTWDGTQDDMSVAPSGAYTIKVLSSQVVYTWEGVIGNTSSSFTDSTTNHAEDIAYGMAITSSFIYYCTGYNEARVSTFKASVSNPQAKTTVLPSTYHYTGAVTCFVATDGTYVYWSGFDAFAQTHSFVYASKTVDDTEVSFSSGATITVTNGPTYNNVIDQVTATGSTIAGLAVQTGGLGYLCVSRTALGTIDVLNKTTGALLSSNTVSTPAGLACDSANGLWVIEGTSIVKYTINSGGTLTATGISITGLIDPLAVAISPDGTTVLVADGGTSQQVKAFNATTGASAWTFGVAGGYSASPAVANNKFFFHDFAEITFNSGIDWAYLAFQPDGSFWVGDSGNARSQYFTAGPSPTYSNTLSWIPTFYSAFVDQTDATRVFANALEFSINYSISLGPANGSWTLVNNWGYIFLTQYYDQFGVLRNIVTLSNGRTYAQIRNLSLSEYEIVELVPGSGVRLTGVFTSNLYYALAADGSLRVVVAATAVGNSDVFSEQALTGFDGSNNPQYGALTTVAYSPPITANGPAWYLAAPEPGVPWETTSSGVIPVLDGLVPSTSPGGVVTHAGWHLGGFSSSSAWQWRASPSTDANYYGAWPNDGAFDIGNSVLNGASQLNVLGRNIFYQYFGEGWKSGEVNEWAHFYDDGLMVGRFGVTYDLADPGSEGQPGMAGNAFTNDVIIAPNGITYAYHNDESYHGGVHRWRIDNLSTIAEQSTSIIWYSWQYQAITDPSDLLAGLPYSASVVSPTAGWSYAQTTQITVSKSSNWWTLTTNVLNYNPRQSPDINISFCQSSATSGLPFTATRSLPTPNPLTVGWDLTTTISWSQENNLSFDGVYFDVLDSANKVIARIYPVEINSTDFSLLGNGQTIVNESGSGSQTAFREIISAPTLLTVSASSGLITFAYGGYSPVTVAVSDPTSVWNQPAKLLLTFFSTITSGYYNHTIDLQTLHFSHVP
jgi:hypothetical protein